MRTHIDWLTFTLTPRWEGLAEDGDLENAYGVALHNALVDAFGEQLAEQVFAGGWQPQERGRAPYKHSWKLLDGAITMFASHDLPHCCVEISGQGCEYLIAQGTLQNVLQAVAERVTRIDVATDIPTDVKPSEFVNDLSHQRMRASGFQTSSTGETCYVGSQKSDRYARVYRYNDPHPRSHLLRIEHVFRREYAKVVASRITELDVAEVAAAAGDAFGWHHPIWQPMDATHSDISLSPKFRRDNNTVHWLVNSCAPAFQKLVVSGVISNPLEFFERYFLPEE